MFGWRLYRLKKQFIFWRMKKIKVGSDFSGVVAFDQALMRLNISHETVFACDMDKFARQTYVHNYGQPAYYPENVYDREIHSQSLDIYMTSPPCQAFSLAGKRLGKDDERGILFFNSHEFIIKNKPRFFIFENVKGLLSDDNGKTFQEWLNYLGGKSVNGNPVLFPIDKAAPYHIYWKVLNAKNYGIPQNRERVFIVGIRDDVDNVFSWPKELPLTKRLRDVLEDSVDEKYFLSDKMVISLIEHSE
jgi:DNA (cytosine-5)-methyltransferase 1